MSFQRRLASGKFVVLAEMNTPKGVNVSELVANSRRIKGRVDAVIIPDMDDGVMRMSALAGGALVQQQGMETIVHIYCRDRNRMALQGDILAAHVLGIRNLMVVPGEEITNGDHRDATPVADLNELDLINAIQSLQNGVDLAGFSLNGSPEFTIGCTLPSFANDQALEEELAELEKKIAAGAQFVVTPPVFDVERFSAAWRKLPLWMCR
jgi:methylenetetrahydrofolate reductase (NADPH)